MVVSSMTNEGNVWLGVQGSCRFPRLQPSLRPCSLSYAKSVGKLGFLNILGPKKEFNWDFPILSYFGGKLGFVFVLKTARTALALLLQPHPPFSYFFFKNLASGLNLSRPETPVATRADSGAPPLRILL